MFGFDYIFSFSLFIYFCIPIQKYNHWVSIISTTTYSLIFKKIPFLLTEISD